jgi:hypothetical protein
MLTPDDGVLLFLTFVTYIVFCVIVQLIPIAYRFIEKVFKKIFRNS